MLLRPAFQLRVFNVNPSRKRIEPAFSRIVFEKWFLSPGTGPNSAFRICRPENSQVTWVKFIRVDFAFNGVYPLPGTLYHKIHFPCRTHPSKNKDCGRRKWSAAHQGQDAPIKIPIFLPNTFPAFYENNKPGIKSKTFRSPDDFPSTPSSVFQAFSIR